ncbi:MAG: hypothetical protein U0R71_00735 [Solirubrobacterales bacterium]
MGEPFPEATDHITPDRLIPSAGAGRGPSPISRAALAVWGFVVGEDWHVAVAVVATLALTALAAAAGLPAWAPPPVLVLAILYRSVRAGSRPAFSRTRVTAVRPREQDR